ncbi:MAG: CapA family protein [Bacteroidales bacterium]|nr:CapA family protein [Bacteroidales bacterium]
MCGARLFFAWSFLLIFPNNFLFSQSEHRLTLLFAGDIMGHDAQIESAKQMGNGEYDYLSCFKYIGPYISKADIAAGNLEVTFAGEPYKGYPAFSSPDELAFTLKRAGFDILVNANNHALDRKKAGLERTLTLLDSTGIIQTGVFRNSMERAREYPLIVEKNNIRLAILNYTYGTNGIRVSPPNIVNYIDTVLIKTDLQKAHTAKPDFVIAMMHWGSEYELEENVEQNQLARFLFRNGTDAIIGSHPHVVQPVREFGNKKLVVFSLGNMISNQRKRYTDGGILVNLSLKKSYDSTVIAEYSYLPVWVHIAENKRGRDYTLVPASVDSSFYKEMDITKEDAGSMQIFLEDTRRQLEGVTEDKFPYEAGRR